MEDSSYVCWKQLEDTELSGSLLASDLKSSDQGALKD